VGTPQNGESAEGYIEFARRLKSDFAALRRRPPQCGRAPCLLSAGHCGLLSPNAILKAMSDSAPQPTAPPPKSWSRRVRASCLRLSIYWLLYTLSIGPMFWPWYEATFLNGERWVAVFYYPLVFVCDHVPPYGNLVNWYINLWILG
jgi:hypothetical protein